MEKLAEIFLNPSERRKRSVGCSEDLTPCKEDHLYDNIKTFIRKREELQLKRNRKKLLKKHRQKRFLGLFGGKLKNNLLYCMETCKEIFY